MGTNILENEFEKYCISCVGKPPTEVAPSSLKYLGQYPYTFGSMSHDLQGRIIMDWLAGNFRTLIWDWSAQFTFYLINTTYR